MQPPPPGPGCFRCYACGQPTLTLGCTLELPPGADSDEVQVQLARCRACGAGAVAVYEESRRGAGESWRHWGYAAPEATLRILEEGLLSCPTPQRRSCPCATHRAWAQGDDPYELQGALFAMELAPAG